MSQQHTRHTDLTGFRPFKWKLEDKMTNIIKELMNNFYIFIKNVFITLMTVFPLLGENVPLLYRKGFF